MTKPIYLVDVRWEGGVNCRGRQLKELLELIEFHPIIENAIWYASDVDSSPIPDCIRNFTHFIPEKIGNTLDLIAICENVNQFLSGVFLAFSRDEGDQLDEGFETEDESFRDIGDAILEIRAFDTTFLEVYANNYDLIHMIVEKFQVKIITEDADTHLRG